jgi:hypothetical protein
MTQLGQTQHPGQLVASGEGDEFMSSEEEESESLITELSINRQTNLFSTLLSLPQ